MHKTRDMGMALAAAAVWFAVADDLRAGPPETLTAGGIIASAPGGVSPIGAVWRVCPVADTAVSATGTVGTSGWDIWSGDIGGLADSAPFGSDCLVIVENAVAPIGAGATGHYAVVNHMFTGSDPAEFPPMTLRPIPIPAVTAAATALLSWDRAVEDPGDGGETNIIGYTVHRSADGVAFTQASDGIVTETAFEDAIPNDADYRYAIGLVYRGDPPVTGAVLSAVSGRVFKNSDGDGLPDYFKIANGLAIGSGDPDDGPDGDPDNDGMSNYEHWISGTRANDPSSYFFVKHPASSGEGLVISWDGVPGRRYRVYRVTSLLSNDWGDPIHTVDCTAEGSLSFVDPTPGPTSFYRLDVSLTP